MQICFNTIPLPLSLSLATSELFLGLFLRALSISYFNCIMRRIPPKGSITLTSN